MLWGPSIRLFEPCARIWVDFRVSAITSWILETMNHSMSAVTLQGPISSVAICGPPPLVKGIVTSCPICWSLVLATSLVVGWLVCWSACGAYEICGICEICGGVCPIIGLFSLVICFLFSAEAAHCTTHCPSTFAISILRCSLAQG